MSLLRILSPSMREEAVLDACDRIREFYEFACAANIRGVVSDTAFLQLRHACLIDATELWNEIDTLVCGEEQLFPIMCQMLPWAFDDCGNANSFRFTYGDDSEVRNDE